MAVMSFESNESYLDEQPDASRKNGGKSNKYDMYDDVQKASLNDVRLDMTNPANKVVQEEAEDSLYESSNDGISSTSGQHNQSQQLINFKKQISTKEMPASIIKLNRLVHAIVVVILAVVIFDTAQNSQFYQFSKQS
jgi:hypothetical protein